MKVLRKAAGLAAIAVAAGSVSGCAVAPKLLSFLHLRSGPQLAVRPAASAPLEASTVSPSDRIYEDAKRAIEVRDYAQALDLLQLAKQRTPNDSRVLNALGVVYDKLGRFDLSARYYQMALAAEPNSPAVLANMRYSEKLQTYAVDLRDQVVVATAAERKPIAAPAAPAPRAPGPLLAGGSLTVVNASGDPAMHERVRSRLAASGWSVSRHDESRPLRQDTIIVFAAEHRRVAEALARTLPFRSTLEDCAGDCRGLELVLGANARRKAAS